MIGWEKRKRDRVACSANSGIPAYPQFPHRSGLRPTAGVTWRSCPVAPTTRERRGRRLVLPVDRWFTAGSGAHGLLPLLEFSSTLAAPDPYRHLGSGLTISHFGLIRCWFTGVEELPDAGGVSLRGAVPGARRGRCGPARGLAVLPEDLAQSAACARHMRAPPSRQTPHLPWASRARWRVPLL
jgi:hypothetical protein